jgi:hypothetical protein
MKLFVQARKDGYNVLYPKPTPIEFFQFAGDIRPDSKDPNLLGKFIYTIAFANGGCIFTKHLIVQDVQRQGLGNIGFSVFIPNVRKLSGDDVINLLDELLNTYCKNYCPDYYLENKPEDWAIFEAITNQYKDRLHNLSNDDTENYQQGTGEAAFVYYIDKIELCKFFDVPYQEEYSAYKQVFFVEKNLEGKSENPLNALRHDPNANLTEKIDLENPKYKLIYNQQARGGVKIEVKVNGNFRYNKSKIKRKEDLEIIWSKQFCETKVKSGKWYEIGSDFFEINDIEKTITVKEIDLLPVTFDFSFEIIDNSSPLTKAEIYYKIGYSPENTISDNKIRLTQEQLQNKFTVYAKNGNFKSRPREIKEQDANNIIKLILLEHKKVKFHVKDENGLVNNYSIQISNKENLSKDDGVVVFIGEEIDKTWQIIVSHIDYETEPFNYCPAKDKNPEYVNLKKKTFSGQGQSHNRKKYYIKIEERKGKRTYKGSSINEYEYKHPQFKCDSKYGYKFERWESFENKPYDNYDNYDGYYEAIFKELWYRKIPKLALVFLFIATVGSTAFLLIKSDGTDSKTNIVSPEISNKINSYVEGMELNIDTLKEYKSKYCESPIVTQNEVKEKSLWQKMWSGGSNDDSNSTNVSSEIPEFCSKIDNAIVIRNAINFGKIDELKAKVFSESQQNFKTTIDSIDDKYKKQIGDTLNAQKVSLMNLNQVADLIQKTQKDLREKETAIQQEEEPKKNTNKDKQNEQKIKDQQKNNNQNQQNSQTQKQQSSGNSLDKEFWDLVHSGNAKMESYSNLLKKHKNKGGDIIAYLDKICKNSASFKKFKDSPEMDRKSAKTLTEIDIK